MNGAKKIIIYFAACVVFLVALVSYFKYTTETVAMGSLGVAEWKLPNQILTPGSVNPEITQKNLKETICNPNWKTSSVRPPASYTTKLKKQQIEVYGYADKNLKDYEEDHLVNLWIAGNPTDPKNLWPQPLDQAKYKDKLENKLHDEVCSYRMTLKEAQNCIANDWIKCYNKVK